MLKKDQTWWNHLNLLGTSSLPQVVQLDKRIANRNQTGCVGLRWYGWTDAECLGSDEFTWICVNLKENEWQLFILESKTASGWRLGVLFGDEFQLPHKSKSFWYNTTTQMDQKVGLECKWNVCAFQSRNNNDGTNSCLRPNGSCCMILVFSDFMMHCVSFCCWTISRVF